MELSAVTTKIEEKKAEFKQKKKENMNRLKEAVAKRPSLMMRHDQVNASL